jgi:hypothetical protein
VRHECFEVSHAQSRGHRGVVKLELQLEFGEGSLHFVSINPRCHSRHPGCFQLADCSNQPRKRKSARMHVAQPPLCHKATTWPCTAAPALNCTLSTCANALSLYIYMYIGMLYRRIEMPPFLMK